MCFTLVGNSIQATIFPCWNCKSVKGVFLEIGLFGLFLDVVWYIEIIPSLVLLILLSGVGAILINGVV